VEPVVATLLAVLVLDEQLTAVQAGGALLVCTGVLLAARAAAPAQPVGGP
jgi:drug/metabolite transporter (DMT)-like permease